MYNNEVSKFPQNNLDCFYSKLTLATFSDSYVWKIPNNTFENQFIACEISSSHGGEYEVQICLLGCTAV
jgi:hypothetical protein